MSLALLQEALRKEHLTFGTKETLKLLQSGKVNTIFLSTDCREDIKERILYYASLGKVKIHHLKQKARELSHICKKNFPISVMSY